MLGNDESDRCDISRSLRKLETRIGDYFNSKYGLDDFKLTKVGLIADIDVNKRGNVAAYLKVLKKVGKVKGFSPLVYSRFDNDNSFCLEGNSNGITFMIYDLEKLVRDQLMEAEHKPKNLKSIAENTQGILRTDVWLKAQKTIRDFTSETIASEQIADLT